MSGELTITSSVDTTHLRITLAGELDGYTAPQLKSAIEEALGNGAAALTLEVADVSFIDSTGISVLVWAHKRVAEQGGALVVRSPRPDVYRVLEITRLNQVFRIE